MDTQTYAGLDERLLGLEFHLEGNKDEPSILQQVSSLRTQLDSLYNSNAELATLNRIMNDLKLWDASKLRKEPLLDSEGSEGPELTSEAKEQLLLANYPAVKEAYNNLIELSTLDIDSLINYTGRAHDKNHDFSTDIAKLLERKHDLDRLSRDFHTLVVKNMVVYEKYVNLVIAENNFWLRIDATLADADRKLKLREKQLYNKY